MKTITKQCLSVLMIAAVVTAAGIGAFAYRDSDFSPVGESEAVVCGGVCLAAGAGLVVGAGAGYAVSVLTDDADVDTEALADADARETRLELYRSASTQAQNSQNIGTAYDNYLNDTQSIALMEGKNAYIRALENGSSESIARSKAIEAAAGYYATKQINIVSQWETSAKVYDGIHEAAANDPNVNATTDRAQDTFVGLKHEHPYDDGGSNEYRGLVEQTMTLVNGSDHTYQTPRVYGNAYGGSFVTPITIHQQPGQLEASGGSNRNSMRITGFISVNPPATTALRTSWTGPSTSTASTTSNSNTPRYRRISTKWSPRPTSSTSRV